MLTNASNRLTELYWLKLVILIKLKKKNLIILHSQCFPYNLSFSIREYNMCVMQKINKKKIKYL